MNSRRPFVGGNWKMNGRMAGVGPLAGAVAAGVTNGGAVDVAVFPAFPHLAAVGAVIAGSSVKLGAQDLYPESDGAFTGEVSVGMLADLGVRVVLVGHSERRHVIGESETLINRKVCAGLAADLEVMLCVGETEQQRNDGRTDAVNTTQLEEGLAGVHPDQLDRVTIAYEPVWAIGTGLTASPTDAQAAHAHIRKVLARLFSPTAAEAMRILYGGSVKPENAAELFASDDIDGGLIGGASLDAQAFNAIVDHAGS